MRQAAVTVTAVTVAAAAGIHLAVGAPSRPIFGDLFADRHGTSTGGGDHHGAAHEHDAAHEQDAE